MNQKELEEEQRLIAVNQIRKSELKAKQKMYASSTTFDGKWGLIMSHLVILTNMLNLQINCFH